MSDIEDKIKCVIYDCCHSLAQPSMQGKTWGEIKDYLTKYILETLPQWQPIETAPEDGEVFLLCLPKQMNLIIRCRYNRVHKYFVTDQNAIWLTNYHVMHEGELWQPMPQPPEGK